eukprot:scaffold9834_cov105-Isochrysis_galbana.AAC.7
MRAHAARRGHWTRTCHPPKLQLGLWCCRPHRNADREGVRQVHAHAQGARSERPGAAALFFLRLLCPVLYLRGLTIRHPTPHLLKATGFHACDAARPMALRQRRLWQCWARINAHCARQDDAHAVGGARGCVLAF